MKLSKTFLSVTFAICAFASLRGQIINTFPVWDGVTSISPFGENTFSTVGQVFTVESGFTQLDAYAFGIGHSGDAPVTFATGVAQWDPITAHLTGPLLFASGPYTLPASFSSWIPLVVPTGGLNLTAGDQYVAFLSSSQFFDGVADSAEIAYLGADGYPKGGAVAIENGADLSLLSDTSWIATSNDLAFAASFSSPVPEPSTYGLIGAGLLLAVGLTKRRRSA